MSGLSERDVERLKVALWKARDVNLPMSDPLDVSCEDVVNALAPVVAAIRDEAKAEALRDAADEWTQGAWSDVMLPKPTPPAVPVIAYSNRVGDWLRERAALLDGGDQ